MSSSSEVSCWTEEEEDGQELLGLPAQGSRWNALRSNLDRLFGAGFLDKVQAYQEGQDEQQRSQSLLQSVEGKLAASMEQARALQEENQKLQEENQKLLKAQLLAPGLSPRASGDHELAQVAAAQAEAAEAQARADELELQLKKERADAAEKLSAVHPQRRHRAEHYDLDAFDAMDADHNAEMHFLDELKAKAAGDTSSGIARLRQMLLDNRPPPATSLLESEEIRALLVTVRQLCVDKALSDTCLGPSHSQFLPLPEYLYVWFGNRLGQAGVDARAPSESKSRAAADGGCARFLHKLQGLQGRHPEIAMFLLLLDACEVDEVSYFMHARRVLVGLQRGPQLKIEVPLATAEKTCNLLIMRHADDTHALRLKTEVTQRLLNSPSVLTASGGVDASVLLAGLLAVYKEEKQQLREMLQVLHKAGSNLEGFPAIHKVRAMLQSVDPTVSEEDVLDIYQRASVADTAQRVPLICSDRGDSGDPSRTVPFALLWHVLQRHGFLIKRQRIGTHFQPDFLHESPAISRCVSEARAAWLSAKPAVTSLVRKAEKSDFECDRLWARHARQLIEGLEAAAQDELISKGTEVMFRLKRLLTSTFSAQSMRREISFPQTSIRPILQDLTLMATTVRQRDLITVEANDWCARAKRIPNVSGTSSNGSRRQTSRAVSKVASSVAPVQARSLTPLIPIRSQFVFENRTYVRPESAML